MCPASSYLNIVTADGLICNQKLCRTLFSHPEVSHSPAFKKFRHLCNKDIAILRLTWSCDLVSAVHVKDILQKIHFSPP
jgi:hypothetical protein